MTNTACDVNEAEQVLTIRDAEIKSMDAESDGHFSRQLMECAAIQKLAEMVQGQCDQDLRTYTRV